MIFFGILDMPRHGQTVSSNTPRRYVPIVPLFFSQSINFSHTFCILFDIAFYKTAQLNAENLYKNRPPLEDFYVWRDERVMEECLWYGWFIDYVSRFLFLLSVGPLLISLTFYAYIYLVSGWKVD